MPKDKIFLKEVMKKLKNRSVQYDIEPYRQLLQEMNDIRLESFDDFQLRKFSLELREQSGKGNPNKELLVKAYALVREASGRILKMRPFDVQLIAGIVMHGGGLTEMQTGEGKTLAAVFPAYLNALSGKGVHVLTFNDYLARRDANWMGPLYEFLGLSVGYVYEGMTMEERREAYACDITYLTAKEAGFDHLRGFLALSKEELIQRPFHFAVIDEADSILIDEARIPLVIAGKVEEHAASPCHMLEIIRSLDPQTDFETDEYERNIFLTEKGLQQAERILQCGNLYDGKNTQLLADIHNVLHAEFLLKRDVDYIVRNGRIELIDEFTGRIAEKRHWPHGLQEALEAKEGIVSQTKGQILASITLQNFIRQYPGICGMTGTAQSAAEELREFYGLGVVVIPTNRPCIRVDYPDRVFTHKEAKYKALMSEITQVHKNGRPILIGTCSVEESEFIAGMLKEAGVQYQVLNAKNDTLEARIIAEAGAFGAVTVSTNMAGRGTDIKLGGEDEQDRERVVALGGLYVIGTNRHESRRIDHQLRGRSGRQGDPGSTCFFTSLEDDLMKRYRLKELIPAALYPQMQEEEIDNHVVKREIARAQRIVEGQNFDIRRMLGKYAVVMEKQRKTIHQWRQDILLDRVVSGVMPEKLAERYSRLLPKVGADALRKAEKQVLMHFINKCWAEYLDYMSYMRESIHLVNFAGKSPVDEFNRSAVNSFDELMIEIQKETEEVLSRVEITSHGIDMEKESLHAPSSTWTYLVNDSPDQFGMNAVSINLFAAVYLWPLMIGGKVYSRFFKKR